MIFSKQVFKRQSTIACLKRLYMLNTCRQFSSSKTFSTKTQFVEPENEIVEDHVGQPKSESGTTRRSINIKVPRTFQNKINQTPSARNEKLDMDRSLGKDSLASNCDMSLRQRTNDMFVYINDLHIHVDIKNAGSENKKNVDLAIPNRKEILRLNFDYEDGVEIDKTNPSQNIQSVTERFWREMKLDYSKLPQYYLKLSKARLTGLVVVTTMAGYGVAPDPFYVGTFFLCCFGTALTSSSANAINQYFEVPFDSQMNRTKNRVLVRGHLSSLHAASFAVITGSLGLTILTVGVNPLTAALGAFNLGLYTLVYTPMKRYSIANTWLGSVVGAIPPMMGWTACTGMLEPGAWLLGAILYAWQFPHFNALSWNLRPDYSRGGYRMCSVVRPELCKRVALRYSVGMIALCSAAPLVDLTTWTFVVDSLPLNVYLTFLAWNFYRKGDSNSSRKLFKFTLIHIPILMLLMLISKKGRRDNESKQVVIDTVT